MYFVSIFLIYIYLMVILWYLKNNFILKMGKNFLGKITKYTIINHDFVHYRHCYVQRR